jgi:hypothetical protein
MLLQLFRSNFSPVSTDFKLKQKFKPEHELLCCALASIVCKSQSFEVFELVYLNEFTSSGLASYVKLVYTVERMRYRNAPLRNCSVLICITYLSFQIILQNKSLATNSYHQSVNGYLDYIASLAPINLDTCIACSMVSICYRRIRSSIFPCFR